MIRTLVAGCALMASVSGFAQAPASSKIAPSGKKYVVTYFSDSIIRVSFTPEGYSRNEQLSDAVVLRPVAGRQGAVRVKGDTVFLGQRPLVTGTHASNGQAGYRIALQEGEQVYGGGERALPLDRSGHRLPLYNNPWYGYGEGADALNYSVPFVTSSKGYGLFFDNPSKGYIDIGKTTAGVLEFGASSGALHLYIILGNPQQVLRHYHRLTGTQPLPPRWAMGNLMSRFGYTSEAQVKEIYGKMKEENIPVDAVIFDLFWFGDSIKGTLGNLEWVNKTKWPDPKRMISDFKKEGVQTILVTEPFFVETSKNYRASLPYLSVDSAGKPYYLTDFYFGKGGLIDIFRKDSRQWFWQFYKKQMLNGVEAWWGDLGEPEKHPANMYHHLGAQGHRRLFSADEVHNIYGHNWTKMLYEQYAKEYPSRRLFSLNRSGFAGSQRYSIFPWTGDVSRSWGGFRAQLPVLLGMSMSGVPYVHSDAGGFAGGEGDGELYVRWLQFAAFTPIFRPHGTALYEVEPAAFSFPSEAALVPQPYRSAAKKAIDLRYLFLPYNYTLAWQQATAGRPLMAPLYYYFGTDTTAARIQDQYMWGESVLVAPVLQKGEAKRKLYLPAGRWMDLFSSKIHSGGQWIEVDLTLDRSPVFIREGSFVPTVSRIRNTSEYISKGQFMLNYLPSATPSNYTWFEDDGSNQASLSGRRYTLIRCTGQQKGDRILVRVEPSNKLFLPRSLAVNITLEQKPRKVLLNGKEVKLVEHAAGMKDNFALWMPSIRSVQVYGSFLSAPSLKIEVVQ